MAHLHSPLEQDDGPSVESYNRELELLAEKGDNTWFKAPWLYAE